MDERNYRRHQGPAEGSRTVVIRSSKEIDPRQCITTEPSFTASPRIHNGKILAMSDGGDTYVMQAGSEFKVLGKRAGW